MFLVHRDYISENSGCEQDRVWIHRRKDSEPNVWRYMPRRQLARGSVLSVIWAWKNKLRGNPGTILFGPRPDPAQPIRYGCRHAIQVMHLRLRSKIIWEGPSHYLVRSVSIYTAHCHLAVNLRCLLYCRKLSSELL